MKTNRRAVVLHSGGMDSSICLALAIKEHGKENVSTFTCQYGQRHQDEIQCAQKIAHDWGVKQYLIDVSVLQQITSNALMNVHDAIQHYEGQPPNTLVVGRNGLMARLAAIHADYLGASIVYMGVMELEVANSGYRDCSRVYMDLKQQILRLDLNNPSFEIRTPLIQMTKAETMHLASELGLLDYLLENTISCYEGVKGAGCQVCPACRLRAKGIEEFNKRT